VFSTGAAFILNYETLSISSPKLIKNPDVRVFRNFAEPLNMIDVEKVL